MINLKALKPNKVSTQFDKHSIFLYAEPKMGKSTTMFNILGDKCLFIATEDGFGAIPGIMAQRVHTVSDIKEIIWQLQDMYEANELPFTSVCFDTVDNLEIMIQKYVCSVAGVQNMGDVGHGKLYTEYDKVLIGLINDLKAMGLGVHFISHSKLKKIEDKLNGCEYEKFLPSLSDRTQKIVLADCYFISFIFNKINEDKTESRIMCFRNTMQFSAGSRFRHMPPFVPLNAGAFKQAVETAIKKEEEERAGSTTNSVVEDKATKLDFKAIMARGSELGAKLQSAGHVDKLMTAVEETLGIDESTGKARLFNQLKESQVETANVLVMRLERIAKELGL